MQQIRELGRSGEKIGGGGVSAIEAKGAIRGRGSVRGALDLGCGNLDCGRRGQAEGFTLVELLVVIAIIALLMSILMPALSRAREQAKDVLGQSNLHEWGVVFTMYAGDNEGYLVGYHPKFEHQWPMVLIPYYGEQDLCLCPAATKFWSDGARPDSPYSAWGIWKKSVYDLHDAWVEGYDDFYGSYGKNEGVGNYYEKDAPEFYRRMEVKGGGNIPVLLDCNFMGGFPEHVDGPPVYNGEWNIVDEQIGRFCLDRHNMAINGVFLDLTVRRILLKELWTLKWNRNFATNGPWTKAGGVQPEDWPDWLRMARDF